MEQFANKAILDTGTGLTHVRFLNRECFAAVLCGDYPYGIATITYKLEELCDKSQKQFRKNITSKSKVTKGFCDATLAILHEVGHFANEEISRSYNRKIAIREIYEKFPWSEVNLQYFKLPDENAATEWAVDWLSIPKNRKIAKDFEKNFFSCFEEQGGRKMEFPASIELTSEIEKIITLCPHLMTEQINAGICKEFCPLSVLCEEYWNGGREVLKQLMR